MNPYACPTAATRKVESSELPGCLQGGNVEDDHEWEDAFVIKIITPKTDHQRSVMCLLITIYEKYWHKTKANTKIVHARNLKLGVTEIRCKGRKNKIQSGEVQIMFFGWYKIYYGLALVSK